MAIKSKFLDPFYYWERLPYNDREYIKNISGNKYRVRVDYCGLKESKIFWEYKSIDYYLHFKEMDLKSDLDSLFTGWFYKLKMQFKENHPELYELKKKVSMYAKGKLLWYEVPNELALRYKTQMVIREKAKQLQEELDGIGQTGNTGRSGSSRGIRSPEKAKSKS